MKDSEHVILNVDDYDPGRYARTKILRQAGFFVLEAATGQQALQLTSDHQPSLILLDVNLPDVGGFEICRQIRNNPDTKTITIVHISASSVENHHRVDGLEAGADSYLVEPLDPSVLIATVRAHLRVRKAEEALRRSNQELEWFAYRAAHDLNEPLRTISSYTDLIERKLKDKFDPSTETYFQRVVEASARMRSLIDGLLKYATVTHDSESISSLDCDAALKSVIANLDEAICVACARITHDPLPIINTGPSFEEVLQNLIANAIKYRRDSVPPEIHISAKQNGRNWTFSVRDNGMGIDPENRTTIFSPFRRLHSKKIPGTGLGLALCQKIITAEGGSIWVEPNSDVGSTFFFTIPQKT